MKTAYLDCFSGVSGDMMLGALIDLGVPPEYIDSELKRLPVDGYSLVVERVRKRGIAAVDFSVAVEREQRFRDFRAIKEMIECSSLKGTVKDLSLRIFGLLAEAEGKVHGVDPEDVHFHEVGGVDSIVDIVGTAIGIDHLGIERVFSSAVPAGTGTIRCEHGLMPVPAPATMELLKGVPLTGVDLEREMVTPTGAAILKALSQGYGKIPEMEVDGIGYGAGDADLGERPNVLRILLGTERHAARRGDSDEFERDEVLVMEAAVDDMNPQFFESIVGRLFAVGCLDVTLTPLYMKKGRPGILLTVIVPGKLKEEAASVIFAESTTIGIRCYGAERMKLRRNEGVVATPFGEVAVKVVEKAGGGVEVRPEFEDLKRLAVREGVAVREMESRIREYLSHIDRSEVSICGKKETG